MIPKPFFFDLAITVQEILQYTIGVRNHRPELETIEKYTASPDSPMPKQRRPARYVCTGDDGGEQWRQKDDRKARAHNIEGTLECGVGTPFRDRDRAVLGYIESVASPAVDLDNMEATEPAGTQLRRRFGRVVDYCYLLRVCTLFREASVALGHHIHP
jgi:hypothetical protein